MMDRTENNTTSIQGTVIAENVKTFTRSINNSYNHNNYNLLPENPVNTFWTVSISICNFKGREGLMRQAHNTLQQTTKLTEGPGRVVAIVGFSGMGKSEMARQFAYQYKHVYLNAAWIDAKSERTMRRSFIQLARLLRLFPIEGETGPETAQRVFQHVGQHIPSSLFIFDNADRLHGEEASGYFGISEYLPKQLYGRPPSIMITSQTLDWGRAGEGIRTIVVTELGQQESVEYLKARFKLDGDMQWEYGLNSLIEKISARLHGFPLGLGLVPANVRYTPGHAYEFRLLQSELTKLLAEITASGLPETGLSVQIPGAAVPGHEQSFQLLWDLTMNKMKCDSMTALSLFQILAYCNPEGTGILDVEEIYKTSVGKFSGANSQTILFDFALNTLTKLSLVHVSEGTGTKNCVIRINGLIQKFARLDDTAGQGLCNLLGAKRFNFFVENFMASQTQLAIPASVLETGDKEIIMSWFKCLASVLNGCNTFSSEGTFKFEENQVAEKLSSCAVTEEILMTGNFIKKFNTAGNFTGQELEQVMEFVKKIKIESSLCSELLSIALQFICGRRLELWMRTQQPSVLKNLRDWLADTEMHQQVLASSFEERRRFVELLWRISDCAKKAEKSCPDLLNPQEILRISVKFFVHSKDFGTDYYDVKLLTDVYHGGLHVMDLFLKYGLVDLIPKILEKCPQLAVSLLRRALKAPASEEIILKDKNLQQHLKQWLLQAHNEHQKCDLRTGPHNSCSIPDMYMVYVTCYELALAQYSTKFERLGQLLEKLVPGHDYLTKLPNLMSIHSCRENLEFVKNLDRIGWDLENDTKVLQHCAEKIQNVILAEAMRKVHGDAIKALQSYNTLLVWRSEAERLVRKTTKGCSAEIYGTKAKGRNPWWNWSFPWG